MPAGTTRRNAEVRSDTVVVETFRSSTCHGTDCGPSRSSVEDLVSHADNGQRGHLPSNRGISLSGYHDHAVWPVSVIYCNSVNGILCWLALGENRSPICLFDVPAVVQTFTDGHRSLLLFKTQTYWDTSVVFHHKPPRFPPLRRLIDKPRKILDIFHPTSPLSGGRLSFTSAVIYLARSRTFDD